MKDILIIGGFNWLGYELTEIFIKNNVFSNIIIIDVLKDYLLKDNKIKTKFDNYTHLYNENIFHYNINIKEKDKLEELYKVHNIQCVLNNIKYIHGISEIEKKELLSGFANIAFLNETYMIEKYVYLTRSYTHEKLLFSNKKTEKFLEENFIFNESVYLINEDKGTLINLPDYIFGNKCYDSNNFFYKMMNVINSKSPLYVPLCNIYCLCDDLLLMIIIEALTTKIDDKKINNAINENVSGPHQYFDVLEYMKKIIRYNNRIILEQKDNSNHPEIEPQNITSTSLFGKYLYSLSSISY
tara:strand:+ start:2038 stop:2931 length:894 start_codon:yes stop_codon:yes gene_type:complete